MKKSFCLVFCYVDDSGELYKNLKREFLYQCSDTVHSAGSKSEDWLSDHL